MREFPRRAVGVYFGYVLVAILSLTTAVFAQTSPTGASSPGGGVLVRARAAWQSGDFDVAEPLYHAAIEAGGLSRDELIEASVHEAAAISILGRTKPALDAFRLAASLKPDFQVPAEAGKRAQAIADQVRREKIAALGLNVHLAETVPSGAAFEIQIVTEPEGATAIAKIALNATDPLTHKSVALTSLPGSPTKFEIPAKLVLPNATLVVQIDALDSHDNRLVSLERRITVKDSDTAAIVAAHPSPQKPANRSSNSRGGFWTTPWPYVLGSAILLAGATTTAYYFGAFQSDDVNVTAARVAPLR